MNQSVDTQAKPTPVRQPPSGVLPAIRYLGPGLVLSAGIVGTGELIATTALGAKTGFVLLWVILLSCGAKVALQLEYGRYTIAHGRTAIEGWNAAPGPRLWTVNWSVYLVALYLIVGLVTAAGILGAAAQALGFLFPQAPVAVCAAALAITSSLLVFQGKYEPVELVAGIVNLVFLSAILYLNVALQGSRYAYGLGDVAGGMTFALPPEGLALALVVFGITGVGAGDIVLYTYWCLEKGYSAYAGPADGTEEWFARARGWMRVMRLDALMSLAIYTLATCGFYFLGAAVLRPQGALADGSGLILQISGIFSGILGEGSRVVFMACALTVLFGTLFANVAGLSRLWVDVFGIYKVIDPGNGRQRRRALAALSWILPAVWCAVYLAIRKPLYLVMFMGVANALFLLVVAGQGVVFRYRCTERRLKPSRAHDFALWLNIVMIGFVAWKIISTLAR